MKSPVKKIFITQRFGENPQNYQKFGLIAHNGLDYRAFLPNGDRCYEGGKSEVFAPHDGKIIENALDSKGYGNYIKIENDKEGSVMGHFSSKSPKAVGSMVKEGEFVGYQGTTGNSTGIHLHWGYYKFPRDRQNGYGGFINQEGLYKPWGDNMSTMYKGYDLTNQDSMKVAVDVLVDVVKNNVYYKRSEVHDRYKVDSLDQLDNVIGGLRSRITSLENEVGTYKAEVKNKEEKIGRLNEELTTARGDVKVWIDRVEEAAKSIEQLGKDKGSLAIENETLKTRIKTLESLPQGGITGDSTLSQVVKWFKELFWKN